MDTDPKQSRDTHEILPADTIRISSESFPLPDRADTFARPLSDEDEVALAKRKEFAAKQAEAAQDVLGALHSLETSPTPEDWSDIYESLTKWRSGLDAARLGQGVAQGRDRITTPITDRSPNRDRIGDLGRLRAGSVWSDEAQAWIGGEQTLASQIVAEAGERALARFTAEGVEGDELQNTVELSDGTIVRGNRIIKGDAAKQVVLELKHGVRERGLDVSQFETGGDMMFTITPDEADRAIIFDAAMQELAKQEPGQCDPATWANIAYLLYQSPKYKKGSDAVIRTFLVAAGTYLMGKPPVLSQDIDLQVYTTRQEDFVQKQVDQIQSTWQ